MDIIYYMYEINNFFMVSSDLVIKCVIIINKYMYVMVLFDWFEGNMR